jgi:hypothetical protein
MHGFKAITAIPAPPQCVTGFDARSSQAQRNSCPFFQLLKMDYCLKELLPGGPSLNTQACLALLLCRAVLATIKIAPAKNKKSPRLFQAGGHKQKLLSICGDLY